MKRIQAFFESMCGARRAADALSEAGLGQAHLDLAGKLEYEYSQELSNVERNRAAGDGNDHLSTLVLGLWSKGLNDKKNLAAAPGITPPGQGDCEEGELKISARLLLKVSDDCAEKAYEIIHEKGGRIFPTMV